MTGSQHTTRAGLDARSRPRGIVVCSLSLSFSSPRGQTVGVRQRGPCGHGWPIVVLSVHCLHAQSSIRSGCHGAPHPRRPHRDALPLLDLLLSPTSVPFLWVPHHVHDHAQIIVCAKFLGQLTALRSELEQYGLPLSPCPCQTPACDWTVLGC